MCSSFQFPVSGFRFPVSGFRFPVSGFRFRVSGFRFQVSVSSLPPSLPLMSPYGLPSAGYPASARWHVFKFPVCPLFLSLLRDLRALTRSLPLILPCRAPCGSLPSGLPSRLGRVRPRFFYCACCLVAPLRYELPTLGYTVDLPLGYALSRGRSLPVDFATLHPSGCLRQSFYLRSIILPFGLPAAGSVGSHPPGMSHPSGCLCSLPRNRPVAWFPASPCWHVFSAALRLPRSLPLISPYGLPAAGYPASPRWHVFPSPVSGFRFQVSASSPLRDPRVSA